MSDASIARLTAERIALELFGKGIVPSDSHAHAAKLIVEAHLAPILARNAAMEAALRECATNIHMICKSNYQSQLLVHIDQLTAKGAGQ